MKHEINVNGLQSGSNTLTIYEGKALDPKYPEKLIIEGDINTVTAFISGRFPGKGKAQQEVDRDKAIIIIDEYNMYIQLLVDPNDCFGTVVTGSLELTEDLRLFQINEAKTFTREAMVKLLRFNSRFFPNKEKYADMLNAFLKFQAKTEIDQTAASDTRGNKSASINKAVSGHGLPEDFILTLPVFKGMGLETFRVEICIETTDAGARFWFESPELAELIDKRKNEIFENITQNFNDFVVVRK